MSVGTYIGKEKEDFSWRVVRSGNGYPYIVNWIEFLKKRYLAFIYRWFKVISYSHACMGKRGSGQQENRRKEAVIALGGNFRKPKV